MELRSVQAVFEQGVLKPTEELGLSEHERVRLIVTSEVDWKREFVDLLERIHAKTDRFPSEEIEADISATRAPLLGR